MRTAPAILLLLWLLTFLWLALWPFDFSGTNRATFVPEKGLQFSVPSIAISDGAPAKITGLDSIALVLSFYPDRNGGTGCIVEYAPPSGPMNFRIMQVGRFVDFWFRIPDGRMKQIYIPIPEGDSLQTFVCDIRGYALSVFHFGKRMKTEELLTRITGGWNDQAQLIFGCTASGKFRWEGTLAHFEIRRSVKAISPSELGSLLLAYDLADQQTRPVQDGGPQPKVALAIPHKVIPPGRKLLSTPLTYWDGQWNKSDVVNNIIAFIPLGFLIVFLFRDRLKTLHLLLLVTGIAATFSLSIEIAQFFVPYRDSSSIDVLTNTFGAFCGGLLAVGMRLWPSRSRRDKSVARTRHEDGNPA
jgi:hypothetical protein